VRDFDAERLRRLQIDHKLELDSLYYRQVSRFNAFEHAAGIHADEAIRLGSIDAVAHQAAGHSILAKVVYRRHRITCRQGHKLFATRVKEWIAGHSERLDALCSDPFERRLDFAIGARLQETNLQIERAHGLLHVA